MSRSRWVLPLLALSLCRAAGQGTAGQGTAGLDDAGLKAALTRLGYKVKAPGPGVYEVTIAAAGLNIPTRVYLAKSRTKLWLSVALLQKAGVDRLTRDDLRRILETNVQIDPCHFMIESGLLKMKTALDNRGLTPAILRSELAYLAARVGDSRAVWQK